VEILNVENRREKIVNGVGCVTAKKNLRDFHGRKSIPLCRLAIWSGS